MATSEQGGGSSPLLLRDCLGRLGYLPTSVVHDWTSLEHIYVRLDEVL